MLPAALRHLALDAAGPRGSRRRREQIAGDQLVAAINELEEANVYPDGVEGL